jgi:hypothetical protein
MADFNHQQYPQSPAAQVQTPLPVAGFSHQTQYTSRTPSGNIQQQPQQMQYAQTAAPVQQWAQPPATPFQQMPQQSQQTPQHLSPPAHYQQQHYLPTPNQTNLQQSCQAYNSANKYQAVKQPQYQQYLAPTQQQGNLPSTPGQQAPAQNIQQPPAHASQSSAGKSWLDNHRTGWGKGKN